MQLSLRIDPDCVAQAEREWMNGFSLLTHPDLCNCVWPRAFLHLHRTFVNKHNLYILFLFHIFPRINTYFPNYTCHITLSALGLFFCLTPILHFSHSSGFLALNPCKAHNTFTSSPQLFIRCLLIAYFIQLFSTFCHNTVQAQHSVFSGRFTLPPQHL